MAEQNDGRDSELTGKRVLVVEDEVTIALLLEDMLADLGCTVVGPAGRIAGALEHVEADALDVAILDVNVAGQPIYPVAAALMAKNVPFVFSTGYGASGIDDPYRDRPVIQKPFSQADLVRALRGALGES